MMEVRLETFWRTAQKVATQVDSYVATNPQFRRLVEQGRVAEALDKLGPKCAWLATAMEFPSKFKADGGRSTYPDKVGPMPESAYYDALEPGRKDNLRNLEEHVQKLEQEVAVLQQRFQESPFFDDAQAYWTAFIAHQDAATSLNEGRLDAEKTNAENAKDIIRREYGNGAENSNNDDLERQLQELEELKESRLALKRAADVQFARHTQPWNLEEVIDNIEALDDEIDRSKKLVKLMYVIQDIPYRARGGRRKRGQRDAASLDWSPWPWTPAVACAALATTAFAMFARR